VDTSRVLRTRPNRPLDSNGREAFVYIMDGSAAHSIKDLTIDDLTPWNCGAFFKIKRKFLNYF